MKIIECVPNFSEGTDAAVVEAIVASITEAPGAIVLDVTRDPDHNRSVVTFAGAPAAVLEGALRGVRTAAERIDLRKQSGVHPRIGAADVVPFVPVRGADLGECVDLAHQLGGRVWDELKIPVYFYEAAALVRERQRLENVRRGEFELLRDSDDPKRLPDVGGPALHPSAGATVIGARKFLIAWNVNLRTGDTSVARQIARTIRESSGGLPCVKALGLYHPSRGLAQVSMNLTDFEVTPMQTVFDAVAEQAALRRVEIDETEIIGLLPRAALAGTTPERLHIRSFRRSMIVEERIAEVLRGGESGPAR
jgi:glutamate formiminotransferase/glutamate formiminotransferase/formiminotetrahydrofolate cyclodeaminase